MKITSSRLRLGATASAAALAAVGILAATGNAVGAGGPAPDRDVRVLQFGVKFSPQNVIDVPPLQQHPGDYRPGDYATFGDVLTNSNGRRVGVEAGAGLITRVGDAGAQIFFNMAIKLPCRQHHCGRHQQCRPAQAPRRDGRHRLVPRGQGRCVPDRTQGSNRVSQGHPAMTSAATSPMSPSTPSTPGQRPASPMQWKCRP